jgi:5-deoxy-glucuronate isomerase
MSAVIVSGQMALEDGRNRYDLAQFDSFYLPARQVARIIARERLFVYIGAALYEGVGEFLVRKFDLSLPLGVIHQIHGKPPYEREVFMTLDPGTGLGPAGRPTNTKKIWRKSTVTLTCPPPGSGCT